MHKYWLSNLPAHEVWRGLSSRAVELRARTAELLCYIAEADARQLYREQACDSMYACCVRVLLMSEDAACRHIDAARVARRFPRIFPAIEAGRLNVSAVLLLKPHLTTSNADELISAAEGQSYRSLKELLASRFPQADLPTRVHLLGASAAEAQTAIALGDPSSAEPTLSGAAGAALSCSPAREIACQAPTAKAGCEERTVQVSQSLSATSRIAPTNLHQDADSMVPLPQPAEPRPRIAPLAAERYALQVTISRNAHDLLRRAQDLLAHALPSADVATVLERALTELVEQLEHAKFAQTDSPRRRRCSTEGRHIPAELKRAVHERDQGQCTFLSADGRRCGSRRRLEYDHIHPVAKGGRTTAENVRLLCRAHNQLEAERRFGAGFMRERRDRPRGRLSSRARLH